MIPGVNSGSKSCIMPVPKFTPIADKVSKSKGEKQYECKTELMIQRPESIYLHHIEVNVSQSIDKFVENKLKKFTLDRRLGTGGS